MSMEQLLQMMQEIEIPEGKQVQELRRHFAAISEPKIDFRPGDILIHKHPETAAIKNAGAPALFIAYLDKPIDPIDMISNPDDFSSNSATRILDCRLAFIVQGKVAVHLMDSREFRPHPDHTPIH